MFRTSFTFGIMAMLVGCADAPTQRSAPTEAVLGNTTNESSTALPNIGPEEITTSPAKSATIQEYAVPAGSHPHDVVPAPDGTVWYTAQLSGELGRLDPATGETRHIPLGAGSSPHGVIVGPDGAPWITDSGLNAIVRVILVNIKEGLSETQLDIVAQHGKELLGAIPGVENVSLGIARIALKQYGWDIRAGGLESAQPLLL